MRLLATPLMLAVLALIGCTRPGSNAPVAAYRSFHKAAQRGELKAAWSAFSQPSQQALTERAREVSEASDGLVKTEPPAFFFTHAPPPADLTDVTLVSELGDEAILRVVSTSGASEVRMVREKTGWKVDLTKSLQR